MPEPTPISRWIPVGFFAAIVLATAYLVDGVEVRGLLVVLSALGALAAFVSRDQMDSATWAAYDRGKEEGVSIGRERALRDISDFMGEAIDLRDSMVKTFDNKPRPVTPGRVVIIDSDN